MSSPKIEAVKKELSAAVAKDSNGAQVNARSEPGPVGLTVITAAIEHAYPGSGVMRVLIDDNGVTYGVHGEKDFAELVRARKWLGDGALPEAAILQRLVDVAFFEGVAIWMDAPAPKVERGHESLTITLYRTWHPSGGKTRVRVTVSASGKAQVVSD